MKHLFRILILLATVASARGAIYPDGAQILYSPPQSSNGLSVVRWEDTGNGTYITNGIILSVGAGTNGIVRSVLWENSVDRPQDWTNRNNLRLRCFVDCGNSTNADGSADSSFLAFNIPFGTLNGNHFRFPTNGYYHARRYSRYVDTQDNYVDQSSGNPIMMFRFNMAMPFTNGIILQIYDQTNSVPFNHGFISANWSLKTAPFAYSNYRLRAKGYSQSPAVNTTTALFTVAGPGIAVGFCESMYSEDSGNPDSFERPLTFSWDGGFVARGFVPYSLASHNQSAGQWSGSGQDDQYMNSYSFTMGGEYAAYDFGTMNAYRAAGFNPSATEAYRWFGNDSFTWDQTLTVYCNPSMIMTDYDMLFFYYGP